CRVRSITPESMQSDEIAKRRFIVRSEIEAALRGEDGPADSPGALQRVRQSGRGTRRAPSQARTLGRRPLLEFGSVAQVEAVEEVAAIQVERVRPASVSRRLAELDDVGPHELG